MKHSDFEVILNYRLESIRGVLGLKAKEYAQRGDRLHNFKVASRIGHKSPVEAAWGMAMKHLVSVIDLVNGDLENTEDNVNEKIGDLINYLILIEALLQEQRFVDRSLIPQSAVDAAKEQCNIYEKEQVRNVGGQLRL